MRHGFVCLGLVLSLAAAGCSSSSARSSIGPAGGTVSRSGDRASITVPADSLATPVEVVSSSGLPTLAAAAVAIGPYFALTPHGTTFRTPASVTIPYASEGSTARVEHVRGGELAPADSGSGDAGPL